MFLLLASLGCGTPDPISDAPDAGSLADASTTDALAATDSGTPTQPDAAAPDAGMETWEELGPWLTPRPGLDIGVFTAPRISPVGDSQIHVVRIDPTYFELRLVAAGALETTSRTVPEWVSSQGLVGAINASMYLGDHLTSVFYMRDGAYVNNGTWHGSGNAVFATGTSDETLASAHIVDRTCEDMEPIEEGYTTLVQSYRMLTCSGGPAWTASDQIYSIAAIGEDTSGRILFIHSRSPYSVHDLSLNLRELPLGLVRLMYAEGGPEASLYVEVDGEAAVSRVGSYETGFFESDDNRNFWPVPNVLGFFARE